MDISAVSTTSVSVEFRSISLATKAGTAATNAGTGPSQSRPKDDEAEHTRAVDHNHEHRRAADSPAHTARRLLSELGNLAGNFGFIVSHIAQGGAIEDLFADGVADDETAETNNQTGQIDNDDDDDDDDEEVPDDSEGEPAVGSTGLEAFSYKIETTSISALIASGPFLAQVIAQTQTQEFVGLAASYDAGASPSFILDLNARAAIA